MRILSIHPAPPDDGAFACVAKFDVEVTEQLRMYGLRLLRTPDGRHLSYAPTAGGKRCATFAPQLAEAITAAAIAALSTKGRAANACR